MRTPFAAKPCLISSYDIFLVFMLVLPLVGALTNKLVAVVGYTVDNYLISCQQKYLLKRFKLNNN